MMESGDGLMAVGNGLHGAHLDTTPITVEGAVEFLTEAAKYFRNRPDGGEDKAFWANVGNAEACEKIADLLRFTPNLMTLLSRLERVRDLDPPMNMILLNEMIDQIEQVIAASATGHKARST